MSYTSYSKLSAVRRCFIAIPFFSLPLKYGGRNFRERSLGFKWNLEYSLYVDGVDLLDGGINNTNDKQTVIFASEDVNVEVMHRKLSVCSCLDKRKHTNKLQHKCS